jgi:hypothetical protein
LPARRRACGRRRWLERAIGQAVKSAHVIENLAWAGNAPALRSPRQFAAIVKAGPSAPGSGGQGIGFHCR